MNLLKQQKIGVLFLDSTKFDLYTPNGNTVVSYNLPPTLIRDLEVLDREALATQITSFIDTNKIAPITIIIALSEKVLFSRDFANTPDLQEQVTIVQDFLDTIPFNNLSTKTFKLEKGFKVVAANRDFYENIKEPFEKKGFIAEAVAPITIVSPELAKLTLLDRQTALKIIGKISTVRQNALEIHYEKNMAPTTSTTAPDADDKKAYKKRLYIMGGVFIVLLLLMAIMAYQTFKPEPKKPTPSQSATSVPQAAKPITATPTITPDANLKKSLRIALANPTRPSTLSAALRSNLASSGFDNIQISTQSSQTSKTRVIFKTTVPNLLRLEIIGIVEKYFVDPSIVEQPDNTSDISIFLQ